MPLWARRHFTENGEQAWQTLCREGRVGPRSTGPWSSRLCVYVHIPFCAERCHFCDCYSFRLGSHQEQHITGYLDLLEQEVCLWSRLGSLAARPVTTIHFGGGTPTSLGLAGMERLTRLLRGQLTTGAETEWALESTASELTPEMLSHLDALGFTRLHVGVQSLQDEVRRALNRRAPAEAVLDTLARSLAMGWIVSVDLIYGLPYQTLAGLLDDIRALAAVGVDGFSLYELQLSRRNRPFTRRHGLQRRDSRCNYLTAQAASRFLMSLGYHKTFFNHFAGARDTNLYFTFPQRGEDLLALGTTADGLFGDYHYRHPAYAAYCRSVTANSPGLQGGLRQNSTEKRLQPLVTALMAGRVPPALLAELASPGLVHCWRESSLLAEGPPGEPLRLTGNGSWFVGNMISQLLEDEPQDEGAAGDGG
jgi:coproporphyrinogen III oxidase-like Fe-S oxidoreductase